MVIYYRRKYFKIFIYSTLIEPARIQKIDIRRERTTFRAFPLVMITQVIYTSVVVRKELRVFHPISKTRSCGLATGAAGFPIAMETLDSHNPERCLSRPAGTQQN